MGEPVCVGLRAWRRSRLVRGFPVFRLVREEGGWGQTTMGGAAPASNCSQSVCHGQPVGRCKVKGRRSGRAVVRPRVGVASNREEPVFWTDRTVAYAGARKLENVLLSTLLGQVGRDGLAALLCRPEPPRATQPETATNGLPGQPGGFVFVTDGQAWPWREPGFPRSCGAPQP